MQSFFVTGIDTEVGKTYVSCALIRQLVAAGQRVVGMKPVASGAHMRNGQWRNDDALQLMSAANVDVDYELVNPYCFEPAIAPHIAAQQTGVEMSPEVIHAAYKKLSALADIVVVEGVGGWYVPVNSHQTMADVAQRLNLPVVLVVGMRLGCLNHAMLTVDAIRARRLKLAGWIANIIDPSMPYLKENIETLENVIDASHLGTMPHATKLVETQNINFKIANIS